VSFQNLTPNPQDTSAFYLKNIYLVFTESNTSSIPSTVAQPPAFSPSWRAIWVNLLWLLSLGIGVTCAVMATILQQWARQYLRLTEARELDPKRKARIHALFSRSTDKLLIKCLGYLLPCYLHLSVVFFFIGLLLFLFDINIKLFSATLWLFGFSIVIYTFFTLLPFFLRDSILFTPVSAFPVAIFGFIICIVTTTLGLRFNAKLSNVFDTLFQYVERTGRRLALDKLSELDTHIFEETFDSLVDDNAIEKFLEAIPGFFTSNPSEPLHVTAQFKRNFEQMMRDFLDRTFQHATVAESVKSSRLLSSLNASRAALDPQVTSQILLDILNGKCPKLLQSVETGHSLRSWSNGCDEEHVPLVRSIVSRIIENADEHGDRWSALVVGELSIPADLLQDYLDQYDNVLLANFNNITRQIFYFRYAYWNPSSLVFRCDASRTLPSLQHDFCDLWNDMVREARERSDSLSISILRDVYHIYIALHKDSLSFPEPFSYTADQRAVLPSYSPCNIAAHRSQPISSRP
jgi:hypothetical protein